MDLQVDDESIVLCLDHLLVSICWMGSVTCLYFRSVVEALGTSEAQIFLQLEYYAEKKHTDDQRQDYFGDPRLFFPAMFYDTKRCERRRGKPRQSQAA